MKIAAITILATIIISCGSNKTAFSEKALTTKLATTEGKMMSFDEILKKHQGKTILIEVWASWCSDCVKNMPNLKLIQNNHPEVAYVFLSADKTADKWKEGIAKHEIIGDHYLISDGMKGEFGTSIDLDWIPRYIIIDKTGKIETYKAIETDFDKVNQTLRSLE